VLRVANLTVLKKKSDFDGCFRPVTVMVMDISTGALKFDLSVTDLQSP